MQNISQNKSLKALFLSLIHILFLWKNRCCERVYNKRIGVIYHHGSRVMRFQKGQQLCWMGSVSYTHLAFFMANHFISRNQPEYMKYWTMTYLDGIDEEGYVSGGMTINGQRKLFVKFAMKPFLAQGVYQYSRYANDFTWIEPYYERLGRIFKYRKETQLDSLRGLYYWEIAMQSGADNNPAMNYFKEDTRSYDCADACAFQYGELKAMAVVAAHLGKTEDAAFYKKEAEELKANVNKWPVSYTHLYKMFKRNIIFRLGVIN